MAATPRELPLSPPQSSGGELTPERASDPNGVCVPAFLPNGMEHIKMHEEFGAGPSSMVGSLYSKDCACPNEWVDLRFSSHLLLPTYRLPNSHVYLNPCKYCFYLDLHVPCLPEKPKMHMGNTIVHTPPLMADESISMMGSPPTYSPSGHRASPPKAKLGRSPRERHNRSRRGTNSAGKVVQLSAPLSELTAHMINIPLRDMDAWVNRSTEERLKEKAQKGKVARPMNSFMLYRSAYAERSKRFLSQNNHQVVSTAAGMSWKMEPAHIRDKYEELARIERDAHSRAHPTYKFKPNKCPPTTTRRRGELTPPTSTASGPYDDTPSPYANTWDDEYSTVPCMHSRNQSFEYPASTRASTPFGSPDSFIPQVGYLDSSWNTSHPSSGMPTVRPHALQNMGYVEDVHFRRGSPMPQGIEYEASNGLAGLPGGTHDELLQPQVTHSLPGHIAEGHMDPQLLNYQSDALPIPAPNGQVYASTEVPTWEDETGNSYLPSPSDHSSPFPYPNSHMTGNYHLSLHHDPSLTPWIQKRESF